MDIFDPRNFLLTINWYTLLRNRWYSLSEIIRFHIRTFKNVFLKKNILNFLHPTIVVFYIQRPKILPKFQFSFIRRIWKIDFFGAFVVLITDSVLPTCDNSPPCCGHVLVGSANCLWNFLTKSNKNNQKKCYLCNLNLNIE